jgi:signal peptidase I
MAAARISRGAVAAAAALCAGALLLDGKVGFLSRTHGPSMQPTLADGDVLLVRRGRAPIRGDIVIARPRQLDGGARRLCKRVARLGADGRLELRGDNAGNSLDSRAFGSVARADVEGVVLGRVWPPWRAGACCRRPA